MDTRNGAGGTFGPIPAGGVVSLTVTGAGGVPASGVSAVVLNVTAIGPTCAGTMTVWAAGSPQPSTVNVSFAAGATIPNQVIAPVGAGGVVNFVMNCNGGGGGTVQMAADVSGWYAA
jgi:hypothetical protein